MGIKILSRGAGKDCNCVTDFMVDTEAEIKNLPTETTKGACGVLCSAGSTAIVAETKSVYMLNTEGVWV